MNSFFGSRESDCLSILDDFYCSIVIVVVVVVVVVVFLFVISIVCEL